VRKEAVLAVVLASFAHDAAHPGLTNDHLVRTGGRLADQYNDKSPLENHHIATTLALLRLKENRFVATETIKAMRPTIVRSILATDMASHAGHLRRLAVLVESARAPEARPWYWPAEHDDAAEFVLASVLHAADVGVPAKPPAAYLSWERRVMDEFYAQGDIERANEGAVVTAGFDRTQPLAGFNYGFVVHVTLPLYEILDLLGIGLERHLRGIRVNLASASALMP